MKQRGIKLALLILMIASACWDGLYAPAQQMVAVAIAALLALGSGEAVVLAPVEAGALLTLWTGLLLALRQPAAFGAAAHGPVVLLGWFLAFFAGRRLAGAAPAIPATPAMDPAARFLARFWALAATLMAFAGMLAISFTPVHHSGRLAAFLGYPIAVGILGLLGLAGALPDLADDRPWAPFLALGSGVGLLLSGSRWVWLVGLLLGAYLLWASPALIRRAFPRALPALLIALATALWAAPAVAGRAALTLAVISAIALWTLLLVERFQAGRWRWPLTGLAALPAIALAPGWPWLLGRAAALPLTEGSSIERLTFLRDGLKLVTGHPWGAGYKAWSALHLQAASYSYFSAEVHSGPLDLLLAFGWLGGGAFLLLLARFLWQLRRGREWAPYPLVAFAGLGALALHALLDWDLSYGLFAFPLWFGFGLIARPPAAPIQLPTGLLRTLAGLALAGALLVGMGDLFIDWAALNLQVGKPGIALLHARAAVALAPWNDQAHGYLGQAYAQSAQLEEALAAWGRARELGPYEPWYAQQAAHQLALMGRPAESAATWREAVRLWPWQVSLYEEALQDHLAMIGRARVAGRQAEARALAQSGQAILAQLDAQKAKEPPSAPRKPIQVDTPTIRTARTQFEAILAH